MSCHIQKSAARHDGNHVKVLEMYQNFETFLIWWLTTNCGYSNLQQIFHYCVNATYGNSTSGHQCSPLKTIVFCKCKFDSPQQNGPADYSKSTNSLIIHVEPFNNNAKTFMAREKAAGRNVIELSGNVLVSELLQYDNTDEEKSQIIRGFVERNQFRYFQAIEEMQKLNFYQKFIQYDGKNLQMQPSEVIQQVIAQNNVSDQDKTIPIQKFIQTFKNQTSQYFDEMLKQNFLDRFLSNIQSTVLEAVHYIVQLTVTDQQKVEFLKNYIDKNKQKTAEVILELIKQNYIEKFQASNGFQSIHTADIVQQLIQQNASDDEKTKALQKLIESIKKLSNKIIDDMIQQNFLEKFLQLNGPLNINIPTSEFVGAVVQATANDQKKVLILKSYIEKNQQKQVESIHEMIKQNFFNKFAQNGGVQNTGNNNIANEVLFVIQCQLAENDKVQQLAALITSNKDKTIEYQKELIRNNFFLAFEHNRALQCINCKVLSIHLLQQIVQGYEEDKDKVLQICAMMKANPSKTVDFFKEMLKLSFFDKYINFDGIQQITYKFVSNEIDDLIGFCQQLAIQDRQKLNFLTELAKYTQKQTYVYDKIKNISDQLGHLFFDLLNDGDKVNIEQHLINQKQLLQFQEQSQIRQNLNKYLEKMMGRVGGVE